MRLDRLLGDVEVLEVRGDPAGTEVAAITYDSRAVTPAALFCCLPGDVVDGHDFAPSAVAAGASALLCERVLPVEATQVVVPRARQAMAPMAAAFYGRPSRRLAVVGVTGTNGKTTTTHLLAAALRADGKPTEVVGTLTGPRTTPESTDLQARLAQVADDGAAAVALEVSSHALVQHRVDATWFAVAVFTNLSPEHLDFHGTMDAYFDAKATLFTPERASVAVVNADDPWGRRLLQGARIPTRPFSLSDATDVSVGATGSRFRWDGQVVHLHLGGAFNVANAVAAATTARELGAAPAAIAEGLSSVATVPGRFETVDAGQPFLVVVDYAHTPASLEQLLAAARGAAAGGGGRVIVVFGCGGDRDRAKRPMMGAVAARAADLAVVTSDNARHEDPAVIIDAVREGAEAAGGAGDLAVEPDRRAAIALALGRAGPGDVVVVAGKGHETTQVIGTTVVPFDDRTVVREELGRSSP